MLPKPPLSQPAALWVKCLSCKHTDSVCYASPKWCTECSSTNTIYVARWGELWALTVFLASVENNPAPQRDMLTDAMQRLQTQAVLLDMNGKDEASADTRKAIDTLAERLPILIDKENNAEIFRLSNLLLHTWWTEAERRVDRWKVRYDMLLASTFRPPANTVSALAEVTTGDVA